VAVLGRGCAGAALGGGGFGALFEAEHHFAFHGEVQRVADEVVDDAERGPQQREPARGGGPQVAPVAVADRQPGRGYKMNAPVPITSA
jgi:hypothetical protein